MCRPEGCAIDRFWGLMLVFQQLLLPGDGTSWLPWLVRVCRHDGGDARQRATAGVSRLRRPGGAHAAGGAHTEGAQAAAMRRVRPRAYPHESHAVRRRGRWEVLQPLHLHSAKQPFQTRGPQPKRCVQAADSTLFLRLQRSPRLGFGIPKVRTDCLQSRSSLSILPL